MGSNSSKETQKPIHPPSIAIPKRRYKKAIVVIGKMGSGKSTFVKMLATPQKKQKIKIHTSNIHGTIDCSLYMVDPALKLSEQDLFIVDTPGLDSTDAVFLTIDKLDEFILQKELQMVALLYILDIRAGREEKGDGKGHICTFFDHMKLRNSIKKKILTCVLSYFDEYYKRPQGNKILYDQYQEIFTRQNIEDIWSRKIEWMSKPQEDSAQYEEIVNDSQHRANKIFVNQWKKLKMTLSQNTFLDFGQYLEDSSVYKQKIKKQMGTILKQNKGIRIITIKREFNIKLKDTSKLNWFDYIIQKLSFRTGLELQSNSTDVVALQHQKMLWRQIQQFQKTELEKCTSIRNEKVYIGNSDWIQDIEGSIVNDKNQRKILNFKMTNNMKEANIQQGKLKLTYKFKTPTVLAYEEYSKGVAKSLFEKL